jgi:predicted nucleic acid-binding protein
VVLVDSSVWVSHFRDKNDRLVKLLETGLVLSHPYVVIEIACGTPPKRNERIALLQLLEQLPVASNEELLTFIDAHRLHGRGCGMVDIALLASVKMSPGVVLWTLDKQLDMIANEFGINF